eukprot:Rmarinus@m.30048
MAKVQALPNSYYVITAVLVVLCMSYLSKQPSTSSTPTGAPSPASQPPQSSQSQPQPQQLHPIVQGPRSTSVHEVPVEPCSHQEGVYKRTMIAPGRIPNLTNFAKTTLQPGQGVDPHSHETKYEVFYCESGSGVVVIEEVDGTVSDVNLAPGVTVVVNPKEKHGIMNTGQEPLVLNYFGIAS